MSTRGRIITEGMRLFGEQGYGATSVAQIERSAGLSAGAGGMYKHFASKSAVLRAGVRERIENPDDLASVLTGAANGRDTRALLRDVAAAGLLRLRSQGDLSRILVRDLRAFPDLLEEFRAAELARLHDALTALLTRESPASTIDLGAVAAILIDAISHYWLMCDIYDAHPLGIDEDTYLDTLAELAARAVDRGRTP